MALRSRPRRGRQGLAIKKLTKESIGPSPRLQRKKPAIRKPGETTLEERIHLFRPVHSYIERKVSAPLPEGQGKSTLCGTNSVLREISLTPTTEER